MCRICTEWNLGRLTNTEASRALGEIISVSENGDEIEHLLDLYGKILDKEEAVSITED